MIIYQTEDCIVSLPLPLFLVVEDVGWWRGEDDSAIHGPFRNRFPRRHCLADYQALAQLSKQLSMRIAVGMVLGEWDRNNLLKEITGATWMGRNWDNRLNQGPWLEETAEYIRENEQHLELAVHGLCHEFWQGGQAQRSEFHDSDGRMRPKKIVADHLQAYAAIMEQNGFSGLPRIFVPPALHHSFGNGEDSMQAVLRDFGIEYVTTRFSRTRLYSPPVHEKITWECGVTLLERGVSPVRWDEVAAVPRPIGMNPILALHWGNLLHPDPCRSSEIAARWGEQILTETTCLERILSMDAADCWRQAAVFYLADIQVQERTISFKIRDLSHMPSLCGPFSLKIKGGQPEKWQCLGARIVITRRDHSIVTAQLLAEPGRQHIDILLR